MTDAFGRRVIAIIPARGGSKRIPAKNLRPVAGLPLVAHSLRHAREAASVSETWVSTDDPAIAAIAVRDGARVVERPPSLSSDTAPSESALLHVLDARRAQGLDDPDLVVFLQATSPARRAGDIDRAVDTLLREGADSLFSGCENSRLIWALRENGPASINYDYRSRQREQDMARQVRENGSIYVFKPSVLRTSGNRLGGRMAIYEMDYWSSFQIDTPEHADLIEWIMERPEFAPPREWPSRLDLAVFDFDGVMTDNGVWVSETGEEMARCDRGDGWGLGILARAGVRTMIVSTETARHRGRTRREARHAVPSCGGRQRCVSLEAPRRTGDRSGACRLHRKRRERPARHGPGRVSRRGGGCAPGGAARREARAGQARRAWGRARVLRPC